MPCCLPSLLPSRGLRRGLLLFTFLVVLGWHTLPIPSTAVETVYSRGLYPLIAAIVIPIGDWTRLPLGAGGGIVAILSCVGLAARGWHRGRRQGVTRRRLLLVGLEPVVATFLALYVAFLLLWGAGYHRQPLQVRLEIDARSLSATEIETLSQRLLETVHACDTATERRDEAVALAALRASLAATVERWDGNSPPLPHRVKRLPAGSLLVFGSAGMILPFPLEATVDAALPEVSFLAVAVHELAHVAGFNGEAEADLAAAVAGLGAADPYARYAVALGLFRRFTARLPSTLRQELRARLPATARHDLRDIAAAVARYRLRWLARSQRVVYDHYLRTQGVVAGIQDYSRGLQLVAAAHRSGLLPGL